MKIIIRNMKYTDLSKVKSLNEITLPENYAFSTWENWFNKGKKYSFVALDNSLIIGYILCDGKQLISLSVNEKYRHNGIGNQLILNSLSILKNDIDLYCRVSNKIALNLYKKYGFIIKEELQNYYRNPSENGYIMVRKYIPITNIIPINNIKKKINIQKEEQQDKETKINKLKKELLLHKISNTNNIQNKFTL